MGNYNPLSPAVLGPEFRPTAVTEVTLSGPGRGLAMRIRPGAGTYNELWPFLADVIGTPGLGLEVLTSLDPPSSQGAEHHFIGTDTGSVPTNFAGWERQDGNTTAANLRGAVDEFPPNVSDYVRNAAALGAATKLKFMGRGADTALTAKRIAALTVVVYARTIAGGTSTPEGSKLKGMVNLSGVDYPSDRNRRAPADNNWRQPEIGRWNKSPLTRVPWTLAEINALVASGATDEFGMQLEGATVAADAFQMSMLVAVVFRGAENRLGYFFDSSPPQPGWIKQTLAGTSATGANAFVYVHVYPTGDGKLKIPLAYDARADYAPDDVASSSNREHRRVYETVLGDGGFVVSSSELPGRQLPIIISATGAKNAESAVYADVSPITLDAAAAANIAQEITTPAGTLPVIRSARIAAGWASAAAPTQPIKIVVRHGAGAPTGGGTLLGTATLMPADAGAELGDRLVAFDTPFTPPASTQLHVLVSSTAPASGGWKVARGDTRSDLVVSPVVAADPQGESFGGTTDSYEVADTDDNRYDAFVALVGSPGDVTTPTEPTPTPVPVQPAAVVYLEAGR